MTFDELKALPVGTEVQLNYKEGNIELGQVTAASPMQVTIEWYDGPTQYITSAKAWESFVEDVEPSPAY